MSSHPNSLKCLAIAFCRQAQTPMCAMNIFDLFMSFKYINITDQNNSWLSQAIQNCYLLGHFEPYVLLVGGSAHHLQTIKLAWARVQLKSPFGFMIDAISDVGGWFLQRVPQYTAMRLEEVICQLIWQVTQTEPSCTIERLMKYLNNVYGDMQTSGPSKNEVEHSLATLVRAGAVYYSDELLMENVCWTRDHHLLSHVWKKRPDLFISNCRTSCLIGRGYNLLTPDKLAVVKWLESVPEIPASMNNDLAVEDIKKAPLAEIEPLNEGDPPAAIQPFAIVEKNHNLQSDLNPVLAKPKITQPDQSMVTKIKDSHHSVQACKSLLMDDNFSKPKEPKHSHQNSLPIQNFQHHQSNPVIGHSTAYGLQVSNGDKLNYQHVQPINSSQFSPSKLTDSANLFPTNRGNSLNQKHSNPPRSSERKKTFSHDLVCISHEELTEPNNSHQSFPHRNQEKPNFVKWLVERVRRVRAGFRRYCESTKAGRTRNSKLGQIEQNLDENQDRCNPYTPTKRSSPDETFDPNNLRRCHSLTADAKCKQTPSGDDNFVCDSREASRTALTSHTDMKRLHHSLMSSRDSYCISQQDIAGSPSCISLTVSPLSYSRKVSTQNPRLSAKSASRLLCFPVGIETLSPLPGNYSQQSCGTQALRTSQISAARDSGFIDGSHCLPVSGTALQSPKSKSSDGAVCLNSTIDSSLCVSSPPNSTGVWWTCGSNQAYSSLYNPPPQVPTGQSFYANKVDTFNKPCLFEVSMPGPVR